MKLNAIKFSFVLALAVATIVSSGCDPADWNIPKVENTDSVTPAPESNLPNLDGCSREIQLITGEWICVDDVIAAIQNAHLLDEDKDGIPNLNDSDIDGDGIPNSHDPDIDGDGLFNGIDDDVDADGVPNEQDADVDGDFIRNRWDLDIDGDLLYNPYDRDSDGDGFDDEEDTEDDEDDSSGNCSDDEDDECDEEMDEETGMNSPDLDSNPSEPPQEPTNAEEHAINTQIATALDTDVSDVVSLREDVEDIDTDDDERDEFDAFLGILLDAIDDNPIEEPDVSGNIVPAVSVAAQREIPQRIQAAVNLSVVDTDVAELRTNVDALADAARELSTALAALANTAVAYGTRDSTPNLTEAASTSAELHGVAKDTEIDHDDVAEIVPSAIETADIVNGPSEDNNPVPVFRIVADLNREFQDEDGNAKFSPLRVAQMIEQLARLENSASIDSITDSARNILNAANRDETLDPLAIIDAFDDAGIDASDGIDETEAGDAADHVSSDNEE